MRPFLGRTFADAGAEAGGAGGASAIGAAMGSGAGTSAVSLTASGNPGSSDDGGDGTATGGTAGAGWRCGREVRRATTLGRGAGFTARGGGIGSARARRASSGSRAGVICGIRSHAPENNAACSSNETKAAASKRRETPGVTAALQAGWRPARSVRRRSRRSASLPEGSDAGARARSRFRNRPVRAV